MTWKSPLEGTTCRRILKEKLSNLITLRNVSVVGPDDCMDHQDQVGEVFASDPHPYHLLWSSLYVYQYALVTYVVCDSNYIGVRAHDISESQG